MAYNESKAAEINALRVDSSVTPAVTGFDILPNRFVKVVAPNAIDYAAAATDATLGVTGNGGMIGDLVPVYIDGIHKVEAGAAITAGQFVTSGLTGLAAVGTQANKKGIAQDSAGIGELVTVALL